MGHRRAADQVSHKIFQIAVPAASNRSSGVMEYWIGNPILHYSSTPIYQFFLRACGFHVGNLRHCQIQLEPAAAAVVAAEQVAILLRRVHGICVCRIESETFDEAPVRLGDGPIEFFPGLAAVVRLNDESFGAAVSFAPL